MCLIVIQSGKMTRILQQEKLDFPRLRLHLNYDEIDFVSS